MSLAGTSAKHCNFIIPSGICEPAFIPKPVMSKVASVQSMRQIKRFSLQLIFLKHLFKDHIFLYAFFPGFARKTLLRAAGTSKRNLNFSLP